MGVKNYNNCMIETVEMIAQTVYKRNFSSLSKVVQKQVEYEASVLCDKALADNNPYIWRK